MTQKVDSKQVGPFLRMLADVGDKLATEFPNADTSTMFRVFFDQMLTQATPEELLIAAAKIVEKIEDAGVVLIVLMGQKETEKRGLKPP